MKSALLTTAVLLLFCGLLSSREAKGVDFTGKELLNKMSSDKIGDKEYARGYIAAVYCVSRNLTSMPDDATMKEVEESARKYLQANPKRLSQPAIELLKEAWREAKPGGKK